MRITFIYIKMYSFSLTTLAGDDEDRSALLLDLILVFMITICYNIILNVYHINVNYIISEP